MTASQTRAEARKKLTGKWGKAALLTLVYAIITYIISFVLNLIPALGSIVSLVISIPLSFGFLVSLFKLNDNNEVTYLEFLNNGFTNFGKVWSVTLNTVLKLILPIILLLITLAALAYATINQNGILILLTVILYIAALIYVIIKQYSYKLSLLVLYDNPNMSGKEAVEKSAELMKGKVWSLFCLNLSFIGWSILACFTLGIGILWLMPYMQIAEFNFYRNLTGEVSSEE